MATQTKWQVVGGKFISGGNGVTASCHHQTKGACGGCYARLIEALNDAEASPEAARQTTHDLFAALRAEAVRS